MRINDVVVCQILENKNVKAYKYGKLKPKIDKLMDLLSHEIQKQYEKDKQNMLKDITDYVNTFK
jgi:hypothetical protein